MNITKANFNNVFKNISFKQKQKSNKINLSQQALPCKQDVSSEFFKQYLIGVENWQNKTSKAAPVNFENDFNNLETINLKNNLQVVFDPCPDNDTTSMEFELYPEKDYNPNSAVAILLANILNQDLELINQPGSSNDYENMRVVIEPSKKVFISLYSKPEHTLEKSGKLLNTIFNLNISQEKLDNAKSKIIENLSEYPQDRVQSLLNGYESYKKEDIERVSLSDIEGFYNELKANSMGKCVVSLPSTTYKDEKEKIINLFENTIPNLKPYNYANIKDTIVIPDKPITIEHGKSQNIERYYAIKDNNTLKNAVTYKIIEKALNNALAKSANEYQHIGCTRSGSDFSKYYVLYAKGNPSSEETIKLMDAAIKELTDKQLTPYDFEKAKTQTKSERINENNGSSSRARILTETYDDGDCSIKNFVATLNAITANDVWQKAQKYFSTPPITNILE